MFMLALFNLASDVNTNTQVDFGYLGICGFVYANKDYVADGSKGEKFIKCKFGDDVDMKKSRRSTA